MDGFLQSKDLRLLFRRIAGLLRRTSNLQIPRSAHMLWPMRALCLVILLAHPSAMIMTQAPPAPGLPSLAPSGVCEKIVPLGFPTIEFRAGASKAKFCAPQHEI